MTHYKQYVRFDKKILIVGFGSIGQAILPLILRHMDIKPGQIHIITGDARGQAEAKELGIGFEINPLTRENYLSVLEKHLSKGDFLLNLSVDVSCEALIEWCQSHGVMYEDTVIEPWSGEGGYMDTKLSLSERSNYAARESMLKLRGRLPKNGPTAVITHGANPGLVSHFLKQALLNIAKDTGASDKLPTNKKEWSELAAKLNVKVIHIAERDTQVADDPKPHGVFENTWSIDGFYSEGVAQPAELGWGSHEKHFPADGARHTFGCGSAIYLKRPGASTRVRTWTPMEGSFYGFCVTHGETISISDYYTVKDASGKVTYRPTVHYAYHPCDGAVSSLHELAGKNWAPPAQQRLIVDEITSGVDELGVLLCGHAKGAYWYGSQLGIEETRELIPYNNATSLQVAVCAFAGMIWAIENPNAGIVEPDEMDHARVLEICTPYLGPVVGKYTDWTPLKDRELLFAEDLDKSDPWQFKNIRVI